MRIYSQQRYAYGDRVMLCLMFAVTKLINDKYK